MMVEFHVLFVFVIGAFLLGIWIGRLTEKLEPKESGYYIIDDRNPEKTQITLDLHKDPDDIAGKRFVVFRVLKKT